MAMHKDNLPSMIYSAVGLMSGTSLDGVDLCACRLEYSANRWQAQIERAQTVAYSPEWRQRLDRAISLGRDELHDLDISYATYLAGVLSRFCGSAPPPDLVASHGHTVHHVPAEGYTRQIGDPQTIARLTGLTVVGDFRRGDVALGGQGAPLVPVVDRLLFGDFAACINLGGFANISYERGRERVAGDITVCNLLLNRLSEQLDLPYDAEGELARQGHIDAKLLRQLEDLPYLRQKMPKSLGREWFEEAVWPLFDAFLERTAGDSATVKDALATASAHIATQLAESCASAPAGKILVTGGGAHNAFLLDGFRQNLPAGAEVVVPEASIVDYKEALAFALLGTLRLRGETNILCSVTGASRDSSGGVICRPS